MIDEFKYYGIPIERVYHCPFHPTAGIGEYRKNSFDRKPQPGMLLRAERELKLDLTQSILIGDKDTDIKAGESAGVKFNLKLLHDETHSPRHFEFSSLDAIGKWLKDTCKPA